MFDYRSNFYSVDKRVKIPKITKANKRRKTQLIFCRHLWKGVSIVRNKYNYRMYKMWGIVRKMETARKIIGYVYRTNIFKD